MEYAHLRVEMGESEFAFEISVKFRVLLTAQLLLHPQFVGVYFFNLISWHCE